MSNQEALAKTRKQEDGFDTFNAIHNHYYTGAPIAVHVHGRIVVFKPERKEVK